MNFVSFKRFIRFPIDEFRMRRSLEERYKIKSVTEIVRKKEEFKLFLLESEKIGLEKDVLKYKSYIKTLDWVLDADSQKNG